MAQLTTRSLLLVEGGPLFRLQVRLGLIKANTRRRLAVAALSVLLTWFVLLALSIVQGTALGALVGLPFLRDFSAYTRFLLATPLFLVAELIIGPRLAGAAEHFVTSGVIEEADYSGFDAAVERGLSLRDAVLPEVLMAIVAYGISLITIRTTAVNMSTWYAIRSGGSVSYTWAGWWLMLFCLPLLNFLVLRWLWRLYLWFQFLGNMRRLNLQLFPTHPDQAGGLGFVGEAQRFYGVILFAYSTAIAGIIANLVVYDKIPLKHFAPVVGTYVFAALAIVVLPLLLFAPKLAVMRRRGLYEYGSLATAYTGSFHQKWIFKGNRDGEPLLGTADIQSLADLGGSYELVEKTKALPMNVRTLIHLIVISLLPMLPLLLTVMPLKDVVKLLFKFLV